MIALHRAGYRMLVQVHDEVGISAVNLGEAQGAVQVMLDCCPIEVPSKVDIESGPSWGDSMLLAMRGKSEYAAAWNIYQEAV
jgi:hypothetical protein